MASKISGLLPKTIARVEPATKEYRTVRDANRKQQGLLDCLQEDVVDIKVIKDTDRKFVRTMASALQRR